MESNKSMDIEGEEVLSEFSDGDRESPKETKLEKKALNSYGDTKIYKQIQEVGSGKFRPSRHDVVQVRKKILQKEEIENFNQESIKDAPTEQFSVGSHDEDNWIDTAVQNMRKGEVSIITLRKTETDPETKAKNHIYTYWAVELIDWEHYVDIDYDSNYMKKVLQRGHGYYRFRGLDEVTFSYKMYQGDNLLMEGDYVNERVSENQNIPKNVIKVLESMKRKEVVECTCKLPKFIENEKVEIPNLNKEGADIVIKAEIKSIIKLEDVFKDKLVLKKRVKKGEYRTDADNKCQEVYFHYKVFDLKTGKEIYSSCPSTSRPYELPAFNIESCCTTHLDEYKYSRLLKKCIRQTEKNEIAEFRVYDCKYLKYGADYQEVMKHSPSLEGLQLKYIVTVYGSNEKYDRFNIDQKLTDAKRKRELAIQQMNSGNHKKAMKIFQKISELFDDADRYEPEEVEKTKPVQISAYLNTTLCMQKQGKWKDLIPIADKILKLDPYNVKSLYRKGLALKNLQEFEEASAFIEKVLKDIEINEEFKKKVDNDALAEFHNLQKGIKADYAAFVKKQKSIYQSMFSGK